MRPILIGKRVIWGEVKHPPCSHLGFSQGVISSLCRLQWLQVLNSLITALSPYSSALPCDKKGHKRPLSGLSSHTIIREDERRGFVWNRRDRWPPPPFPASPDKVYHAQTAEVAFWISFSLNNHVLSMFLTESLKWTNHSWLYFLLKPCFCI